MWSQLDGLGQNVECKVIRHFGEAFQAQLEVAESVHDENIAAIRCDLMAYINTTVKGEVLEQVEKKAGSNCPCQIPGQCPCVRREPEPRTPRRSRRPSKHEQYIHSDESDSTSSTPSGQVTWCSPPNAHRHPYQAPTRQRYDDSDSDSDIEHLGYGYNAFGALRERAADAPRQHDRVHARGREKTGLVRVRDAKGRHGVNTLTGQPGSTPPHP